MFYDGSIGIFGFGYILDRFFVFLYRKPLVFRFGVLRGLLIFLAFGFPFSKILMGLRICGFADLICDVV